jgi:hypothetical protein
MFDNDQSALQIVFDGIIDTNFEETILVDFEKVDIIFEKLNRFKSFEISTCSLDIQKFYLLYLFSNLLTQHLDLHYNYDQSKINNIFYLPNIINILINKFDGCKKILSRDIKTIYKQIKNACENVIDFYLVFYNSEPNIIQNDILNIFLLKIFREHNPLDINNLREYYDSLLRYLFYSYLKSKTDGFIESDLSPVITKEEHFINQSVRSKLYNNGIKISEILQLCHESTTLKNINNKYYSIKYNILTNELQKIYSMILNKDSLEDPKLLLLLANSEKCINLNIIKSKCPIIYKILRCLHIDNHKKVSDTFLNQVQKSIHDTLYINFNGSISNSTLLPLIDNISKKISSSLCFGSYMDILTLEIMDIENVNFLIQLNTFFNIVLSEIDFDVRQL